MQVKFEGDISGTVAAAAETVMLQVLSHFCHYCSITSEEWDSFQVLIILTG